MFIIRLIGTYNFSVLVQSDFDGGAFLGLRLRGTLTGRLDDDLKGFVDVDRGPAFTSRSEVLGQPVGINPFCRNLNKRVNFYTR